MRRHLAALITVSTFAVAGVAAEKPPRAEEIFAGARAQAAEQQKNIFIIFGASWCEPCHELEAFLASAHISPIITEHFVVARVTVAEEFGGNSKLNNPGGQEFLRKLGGEWGHLPFFAFVDPNGELIINSRKPARKKGDSGDIGFPTEPDEIDWFLTMLRKGAPGLSPEDTRVIENTLRNE
jgi:thioredoxin-related protein